MTEKRFLSFVLVEGILLTALGLCMLLLPKITSITFGLMVCLCFIIYGIYKSINAFLMRNYIRHYLLNIILGLILAISGVILFVSPMFNLLIITSIIGIYFILESISSMAFSIQNRKTLYFWWLGFVIAVLQFLLGLIIIIGLPSTALWVLGVLAGINFLSAGLALISMSVATKYVL